MTAAPRRPIIIRALFAVAIGAMSSCGDAPTGSPTVQLYTTDVFPPTAGCGGFPVEWTFRMHLVNTTAEDVTVDSVGIRGVVRSASTQEIVGRSVYVRSSVGFTPNPALLRAHDGDRTIDSIVNTPCFTYEGVHSGYFANVDMTVLVFTSAGLFPSRPINIVHTWTF